MFVLMKTKSLLHILPAVVFAGQVSSAQDSQEPEHGRVGKVLFVLTSHAKLGETDQATGYHLSEVSHPYQVVVDAGFEVDFASPMGSKPPVDGLNLDDPVNATFWNDPSIQKKLNNTQTIASVNSADYDAIYFAGGHGTMWDFPSNPNIGKVTAAIYEAGGVVAAVCHGLAALVDVKLSDGTYLVAGKEISVFTNEEEIAVQKENIVPFLLADRLVEQGAKHMPVNNFKKQVVVSFLGSVPAI
ncbi:MAG: type 1 glutamine amidotransferase domain-containing protein [Verrucomicrobia bacterium]|nr:MAG: type 1 glutamine amidotransferase domain-containing protein [Verrucomicrobiota bacterium]